jgi:hypothetical protein
MLKEIAPRVRRVAIMFNPDTAPAAFKWNTRKVTHPGAIMLVGGDNAEP